MRVCHLNTCPVGIATQDPKLRLKFSGDPNFVVNFMRFVAGEVRELMARLGFRTVDEMVGRGSEVLEARIPQDHPKAKTLDLSAILFGPDVPASYGRFQQNAQNHELEKTLDKTKLLKICKPALERSESVYAELDIQNTDRAVGTLLGGEISRRFGAAGLPENTIQLRFKGSAGQSFGAFVPAGVTLMRASFADHAFERHSHDCFALGATTHGIQRFRCKGRQYDSRPGDFVLFNPDDDHDGRPGTADGFRYTRTHSKMSARAGWACLAVRAAESRMP